MGRLKIRFVGDPKDVFLSQLVGYLREHDVDVEFSSTTLGEPNNTKVYNQKSIGSSGNNNPFISKVLSYLKAQFVESKNEYDIIHFHNPTPKDINLNISNYAKCFVSFWSDHLLESEQFGTKSPAFINWLIEKVNITTVVSHTAVDKIKSLSKELNRIEVIPLMIRKGQFKTRKINLNLSSPVGYCFSQPINSDNGADIIIEAFVKLADYLKDIFLIMCGQGEQDYINSLKKRVRDFGAAGRVHFVKAQTIAELNAIFDKSDIYVHPFRKNGYNLRLMQALSSGLPVIATESESISDLIIPSVTGFTFERENIDQLIKLMYKCYNNKNGLIEMSNYSRRLISEIYNFDVHGQFLKDLYREELKSS